jgi:hypothetical protein
MGLAAKLDLLDSVILLSLVAEVERIIVDSSQAAASIGTRSRLKCAVCDRPG